MKRTLLAGMVSALALASAAAADIKIAHIYGKTGPFEAYAAQSHAGLMMGLEYATGGTMEIDGEPIVVIEKDTLRERFWAEWQALDGRVAQVLTGDALTQLRATAAEGLATSEYLPGLLGEAPPK